MAFHQSLADVPALGGAHCPCRHWGAIMGLAGGLDDHSLQHLLGVASTLVNRCDRTRLSRNGPVFGGLDGFVRADDQKTASQEDACPHPALCTGASGLGRSGISSSGVVPRSVALVSRGAPADRMAAHLPDRRHRRRLDNGFVAPLCRWRGSRMVAAPSVQTAGLVVHVAGSALLLVGSVVWDG